MGRAPCCQKFGLKKGPWTAEEDQKLIAYIQEHGHGSWKSLPQKAGLLRCGKSCRLRWANYLRPGIKRGKFTVQEEQTIIQLHALLGNRWSAIAAHLPKRTDNEIKNYWNTHVKKRLLKMGIDPVTHKPTCENPSQIGGQESSISFNLSHKAQWESARLEAEARLTRRSNSQTKAELSDITWIRNPTGGFNKGELNSTYSSASSSCLNLMKKVQNNWNNNNCQSITIEMTSTLAPLEGALTQVNPTSSCLSLLQQAMCPSSKIFYNEVKKFIALRKNSQVNKPLQCSDVSLQAKNSSNDHDIKFSDQNSTMLSDEVSGSTGFDSCATYDGFSTDMLLDIVENGNSLLPTTSVPKMDDQLCMQETKDYWSSILDFVNSSPNNVQGIF